MGFSKLMAWALGVSAVACAMSRGDDLIIERAKRTTPKPVLGDKGYTSGWSRVSKDIYRARFYYPAAKEVFKPRDIKIGEGDTIVAHFKEMGITLGGEESVTFDEKTSILTVVGKMDTIGMVQVLLEGHGLPDPLKRIAVRLEIYEVTDLQALQLAESAAAATDHTPERNAALKAVRAGKAKLASTSTLVTKNGLRANVRDAQEFWYPTEFKQEGRRSVGFDFIYAGTECEIEPIFDRERSLSLNLALQYHTAPPDMERVVDGITSPSFHAKRIATTVMVEPGKYRLLGTWTPTGKPEYSAGGLSHVVFAVATLQQEKKWGMIETAEEQIEKKENPKHEK